MQICHLMSPSSSKTFLVCLINGMCVNKGEPFRIHIDESVRPVARPHPRIPFHVRNQVEDKLRQLENEDIIERAEGPTLWVSPIVVVPKPSKPNEIRIYVDMRSHNQAIIRERLTMWCQTSMVAKSLVKLILIKSTTRPRSTLIRDNSRRSLPRLGYFATSGLNLVSLSCGSLPKERE